MAHILIVGERCIAQLSEPDDEGLIGWRAKCGVVAERWDTFEDAEQAAEIHVDHQCEASPFWRAWPRNLDRTVYAIEDEDDD